MAEYRAAAERDPRRFACGYLAGDPASGARGAFLWFATPDELFGFVPQVEIDLLQFAADEAARIVANVRRATERSSNLARVDRDAPGPISDAETNLFVAHLRRLFLAREDDRADRD